MSISDKFSEVEQFIKLLIMWHEARKQERKIRGMLVDYRKRAERRRDFYEKIKADPTQFLQVHGRQCKIHLDPNIAAAADSPATMMPWQGHNDNLIDRFDVRAHLDMIPNVKTEDEEDLTYEERQINYERYRIIAQNSFLVISEEKFLKQLHLEEQFGYTENEPKKKKTGGAAIGFNYEDGTGPSQSIAPVIEEENSDENSDSDLDVDLSINVSKLDQAQAHEMNRHGRNFGMSSNDFYSFLTHDLEEAESFRLAKEEEHEKALFSGRKSRRERRAHREKRLANRKISPPSYAARESPTLKLDMHDKSESRSPSPENAGKITFITSFGGEEEQMPSKPTYADKVKFGGKFKKSGDTKEDRVVFRDSNQGKRSSSRDRLNYRKRHRERHSGSRSTSKRIRTHRSSTSDSRSPSRGRRSRSKSRSRSKHRSYSRNRRASNSRSRSIRRSTSRSVRRSTSRPEVLSRSKTRNVGSHSRSRSDTRNRSKSNENNRRRSTSIKSFSRSRSRSTSRSISRSKSTAKSRSRSKSIKSFSSSSRSVSPSKKGESPPKPLPRYYGRRKSDQSSSEIGDSSEEEDNKETMNAVIQNTNSKIGNSGTSTKSVSNTSLSLQERLKRKRQALLNKQFKADKIAEQLKTEREKQEQQTREDELREMALKLRRRQRERRHAYDSDSSDSSSSSDGKTNVSSENKKSRSPSPKVREYRDTDYRSRDRDYKYRNDREQEYKRSRYSRASSRERSDRYTRRPSKTRYDEKRHDDRERDRFDRDDRDDRRRDSYRDKRERSGNKSLVDY